METAEREKAPMLWYWSIPENGMDIEDCEKIAKEISLTDRITDIWRCILLSFEKYNTERV